MGIDNDPVRRKPLISAGYDGWPDRTVGGHFGPFSLLLEDGHLGPYHVCGGR